MSAKTANVTARIQPEIKEQAEAILSQLGIPVSVFIDMAYRQAGLDQARRGESSPLNEAFARLRAEI